MRLSNVWLAEAPTKRPAEVVAWLGAVQSQDRAAAEWARGGGWRRTAGKREVALTADTFVKLSRQGRVALDRVTEAHGRRSWRSEGRPVTYGISLRFRSPDAGKFTLVADRLPA